MFDSYQGTIDYDGETLQQARQEAESYFIRKDSRPLPDLSLLAFSGLRLASACLISKWDKRDEPLVSYLMTASAFKGQGLAGGLLSWSLSLAAASGYAGLRAVVTEGNVPSERVMAARGFTRAET
jgi:RimJ/RimL family protein N-acetyltransferase